MAGGLSTRNAGKLSTALGYWQRAHENMSGEEKTQLGITIADLQKQIDNGVKSLAEVEVAVFFADDLKERISPDDTLFIFAKAAQGPDGAAGGASHHRRCIAADRGFE